VFIDLVSLTEPGSSKVENRSFLTSDVSLPTLHVLLLTDYRMLTVSLSPDKAVFGVPLMTNVKRSGRTLPPSILAAIDHLINHSGLETSGLFRRGASKAKIDGLKLLLEANPDFTDFTDFTSYEVADLIKLYFRELPEALLSSKLTETLIMIQDSESVYCQTYVCDCPVQMFLDNSDSRHCSP